MLGILTIDGREVEIVLVEDPNAETQAMTHGNGMALSYRGSLEPGPLRDAVLSLGRTLQNAPHTSTPEQIRALFSRAASARGDFRWREKAEGRRRAPAPELGVRGRMSRRPGTEATLWPFDPELALLRAGQRSLIKREDVPIGAADAEAKSYAAQGLYTTWLQTDAVSGIVFVARDPEVSAEALACKTRWTEAVQRSDRILAQKWLGTALGYPACCVERFTELEHHDDWSVALDLLPRGPHSPASPHSQWLTQPATLVSHSPCSIYCEATVAVGQTAADALWSKESPAYSQWRDLSQRVHIWTPSGARIAIKVLAEALDGATIEQAHEIQNAEDGPSLCEIPELAGEEIRIQGDDLVIGPHVVSVFADHRGPLL